jgi:dTDP-4-dehydrorhamnose reductase
MKTLHSPASDGSASPPLPMLVTGIAGVAGYNAFHYFHSLYPGQVVGLRRLDNFLLRGPGIVGCNIDDRVGLLRLFEKYRFRSVLSSEGTCALRSCEMDPPMAWRINVLGAMNLAEATREFGARIVHMSIDLVFSGDQSGGGYTEIAKPDPVTVYGKTMVHAEQIILHEVPSASVLRISLPMGVSFNGHAGAIDWIQSRFQKGKPATLYYDEIRTPTYTDCLNGMLHSVLPSSLAGLFHAGGPRPLSLFQIAQIVNRVGGYDPRHLQGCPRIDAGPMPPRAGDVSMNSNKLTEALGYSPFDPWPVEPRWVPDGLDWHFRREQGERGSPQLLAEMLYCHPRRQIPRPPLAHRSLRRPRKRQPRS